MSSLKKAAKGSIVIFLGSVFGAVFAYLFRMVLTRKISVEEYGLFAAVFAFIVLFEILRDLGVYSALVKYVSQSFALKKEVQAKKILLVSIISETVLAGVIALVLKSFDSYLAIHYFKQSFVPFVFDWILIYFVLVTIYTGIQHAFLGIQKPMLFALHKPLFNVLSFLFVFFIPVQDARLPAMALVAGIGGTTFIAAILFIRVFKPLIRPRLKDFREFLPKLLRFGIPAMAAGIGAMAIAQFDTLILTYFRDLREVGVYNVVLPTALFLGFIGDAVGRVFFPLASELEAKHKLEKIKNSLLIVYKFILIPAILVSLPLLLFPGFILGLMFGEGYAVGGLALQILLIGVLFSVIGGVNLSVIYGLGCPRAGAKIMIGAAFLNIILNLLLIPFYGIAGAAIATSVSFFIIAIGSFLFLRKRIQLFFPTKFFFFLSISWLIAFMVGELSSNIFYNNLEPIWSVVAASLLSGLTFFLTAWVLAIFRCKDLHQIASIFKGKRD